MKKTILASLLIAVAYSPLAAGQSGPMDRCAGMPACDAASDQLIKDAQSSLADGHHREAARVLYPAVLSRKTSPLAKARASNALSDLLEQAGLYEYAAVQKRNATETTRAPSSEDLLAHARLVAKGTKKERTLKAYGDVEALAIEAANLSMIDTLIGDYTRLGERGRANALQTRRAEVQARADEQCALVDCRSKRLVTAKIQELGPVEYPREARRQVGNCKVTLNVTETGRPVDLTSDCSDPVFVEAAMIAVQESTFTPRFENGVPHPEYNVVMPFAFEPG